MKVWKAVFAIAALFTLGAGLPPLLAPGNDMLGFGYADTPQTHLMVRMVGLLITMFGIGYGIIARNPPAHRDLALLGVIGKSGAVVLMTSAYMAKTIPLTAYLLGAGDIVFVVLFAIFLWKTGRPASAAE